MEHTIETVTWMKQLEDKSSGKKYYTLGVSKNLKNTLAVTPVGGDGRTLWWCIKHKCAYQIDEACLECRTQVREDVIEAGVTSCDTP